MLTTPTMTFVYLDDEMLNFDVTTLALAMARMTCPKFLQ